MAQFNGGGMGVAASIVKRYGLTVFTTTYNDTDTDGDNANANSDNTNNILIISL